MTTGMFMDALERQGVVFSLAGGTLTIAVPDGALRADQRAELDRRRAEVEALVRSALVPWTPPAKRVAPPVFGELAA